MLFCSIISFAQQNADTLILSSGERIASKVLEISPIEIKYKRADNLEGPTIIITKSQVLKIKYSNGVVEKFELPAKKDTKTINKNAYEGRSFDDPNAKEFTKDDLHSKDIPMIYYGIDYTLIRLIGSAGFSNPANIVYNYFGSINRQIVVEKEKFNFQKKFKKNDCDVNLEMLKGSNRTIDPKTIVTDSDYSIDEKQVTQRIEKYNPKAQEGLGFVIIMESWNKIENKGTMYFTIFDIKTKKILYNQKVSGTGYGFGIRNFWMNTVYEAMKKIKKDF